MEAIQEIHLLNVIEGYSIILLTGYGGFWLVKVISLAFLPFFCWISLIANDTVLLSNRYDTNPWVIW